MGESRIEVRIDGNSFDVGDDQIIRWIQRGVAGLQSVYRRFPVRRATISVAQEGDDDDVHGTEYDGSLIRMRLGRRISQAKLDDDWVMTHELLHLAFPDMGDEHQWMNEGLSVYLEPIARARIGIVSPERYWQELVEGLRNGQPEPGDGGLDVTHTWGRTYWGGTIFYFLADTQIRAQTHNRKSLDDAVRAVLDAGGDGSVSWDVKRVLAVADQATGTQVMDHLYAQLAHSGKPIDVDTWFAKLGVIYRNGKISFDDRAELADVRNAMLRPSSER